MAVQIKKHVKTPVDRFVVFPTSVVVKNFKDTEHFVEATIVRDPKKMYAVLSLSPSVGEKSYQAIRFHMRYKGAVDVLPRRLIATSDKLRFYLRGDIESLQGTEQMKIRMDEQTKTVDCSASLSGSVLVVEFQNIFDPGDHRAVVEMGNVTFPLLVSVRQP